MTVAVVVGGVIFGIAFTFCFLRVWREQQGPRGKERMHFFL